MKLPGSLSGLAFVVLTAALPACTCNRSEAPGESPAPTETVEAEKPAQDDVQRPVRDTSRTKLRRIDQDRKRPMMERVEHARPLLRDAGAPKRGKSKRDPAADAPKGAETPAVER